MQAEPYPTATLHNIDDSLKEMIDNPVDYNEQRMMDAVNHPAIKNVRVFRKNRKNKNKAAKMSRRKNR
jgi:hypothetical protein